ncbi:MAG: hypothetical protein AABX00_01095 [Nanoarchaeota archaeon]
MSDWKYDIWREGKYLDLWHVNHTLAGSLLAGITFFFNIKLLLGFVVSVLLMLAWEFYEIIVDIEETIANQILDVLTGILGFFGMFYLLQIINHSSGLQVFLVVLVVWLSLELWGFVAYKKKKAKIRRR